VSFTGVRKFAPLLLLPLLMSLNACNSKEAAEAESAKKGKLQSKVTSADAPVAPIDAHAPGTPMAERVAVLGLLNKRTGQTRDIELKPGEALRFGKVVVRLRACERTAPWEANADQGAFVQLIIYERPPGTVQAERWRQVFSGWLFKENPAANVVEHGVYDVWVKACKMSFPGEEDAPPEPLTPAGSAVPDTGVAPSPAKPVDKKPSNAPQVAPKAKPAPEPVAEPDPPVVEEETIET
jgi:hypothetical protein